MKLLYDLKKKENFILNSFISGKGNPNQQAKELIKILKNNSKKGSESRELLIKSLKMYLEDLKKPLKKKSVFLPIPYIKK